MLSQLPTPAKMSQEAARKLPRYALHALLAVFILCGFWARDLWTLRDAASFGIAFTMAEGGARDWLLPNVEGAAVHAAGPLTGWISAIFIKLFGSLAGDVQSFRAASLFWFALSTAGIWYATLWLARRPEVQPVAFAFGGEASPSSYSRVIADCAVLLFVATFGIVTRQHEAIPETAFLALTSITFLSLVASLRRPYLGAFCSGLATGFAVLAYTLFAGIWLLAGAIVANAALRSFPGNRDRRILLLIAASILPFALWFAAAWSVAPQATEDWFFAWALSQSENFGLVSLSTLAWIGKNFVWYLCPIWPLALWGLYSWRWQLDRTALFLPLILTGTNIFAAIFSSSQSADAVLLGCIPSMASFAAFGLATLRRNRKDILDWFSVSVFSLGVLTLWTYWLAWLTIFAPKMARSIAMLAPGARPAFDTGFVAALCVTVIWFVFVSWRMTHRPVVAWRGPWLAAAGMTAAATVIFGLYHHAIDINRSYEPIAAEAAALLKEDGMREGDCVSGTKLPPGVRAVFSYYGHIPFAPDGNLSACRYRIERSHAGLLPAGMLGTPIARPHTDEVFYVLSIDAARRASPLEEAAQSADNVLDAIK